MLRDGQTYSRWFTVWPSTHVNAGQTVEVMPVSEHEEAMRALRSRYTDQRAHLQCACHVTCGDVPEEVDDTGTCKSLPRGEHR